MDRLNLQNSVEAIMTAKAYKILLGQLVTARQNDPQEFTNMLAELRIKDSAAFSLFTMDLLPTKQELGQITLASFKRGVINEKQVKEELTILGLFENEKEIIPTANELFQSAFEALSRENPNWRQREFLRSVESRIKKYFAKTPKQYTEQDITVAANWYNTTRKKALEEINARDKRSRSDSKVKREIWQSFYEMRFKIENPPFAREFERKVNALARKMRNNKDAQPLTH
jgi:hypothetical protein